MILHTHFLVVIISQSKVILLIHRRFSAVFLFTTTSVFTFFFFKLADLSSFLADQVNELFLLRARVNLSTWHWILPLSAQGHDS